MDPADRDRAVLGGVVFAVMLAQVLLYPGIPELVAALGSTTTFDASKWFLGVEFVAFLLFAGPWGAASDATGRRTLLVATGAAGGAVGYLALAALPVVTAVSFTAVLALRALQGAMTIGALSLAMTGLMDLPGGHGRNMGAAGIAIGLGVAAGAPAGGALTEHDPLAPLVVAGAVLLAAAVAVLLAADRVPAGGGEGAATGLASVVDHPALAVPYAFGFVDRLTAGFFALVGTFYFREVHGLDAGATGITLALFFAPFALLQYPFGALSDRVGRRLPIAGGSAAYGLAVAWVGVAGDVRVAQAGMVAVGVLGALMAPATMALVTDIAGDGQRGVAMAGFNAAGSAGFLVGILGGGTLADAAGFVPAFLAVAGLEIGIAVVALPALFLLTLPEDGRA